MERIKVHGKYFKKYMLDADIQQRVTELAGELTQEYEHKNPIFIGVLNGAFMFAADLFKAIDFDCEITFVKISSYEGLASTGRLKTTIGMDLDIKDRHVIIIEDVVDSGRTMTEFIPTLEAQGTASVEVVTFLLKPEALQYDLKVRYIGFSIPNDFVVGYGLDYDQKGRNWRDIYQLDED